MKEIIILKDRLNCAEADLEDLEEDLKDVTFFVSLSIGLTAVSLAIMGIILYIY